MIDLSISELSRYWAIFTQHMLPTFVTLLKPRTLIGMGMGDNYIGSRELLRF